MKLPAGSAVNYVKASTTFRIAGDNGITLIGTGSNETLSILVQYSIGSVVSSLWYWWVIGIVVLGIIAVFFFRKKV